MSLWETFFKKWNVKTDSFMPGVTKTRNGKRNGMGNGNGKRNESFEGKQNVWISLIQLLTKENDMK